MSALLKQQLHDLINRSDDSRTLNMVQTNIELSRFALHAFVDNLIENSIFQNTNKSAFDYLSEWEQGLGQSLKRTPIHRICTSPSQKIDYVSKLSRTLWMLISSYTDIQTHVALSKTNQEMYYISNSAPAWPTNIELTMKNIQEMPKSYFFTNFTKLSILSVVWNDEFQQFTQKCHMFFNCWLSHCRNMYSLCVFHEEGTGTKIPFCETAKLVKAIRNLPLRIFKTKCGVILSAKTFRKFLKSKTARHLEWIHVDVEQENIIRNESISLQAYSLPPLLRRIDLPLLANNSWLIRQNLKYLQYIDMSAIWSGEGYQNKLYFLTIEALNYLCSFGHDMQVRCPELKSVKIALSPNNYTAQCLQPIIQKMFHNCKKLQKLRFICGKDIMLGTALTQDLKKYQWNLNICAEIKFGRINVFISK